MSGMTGCVHSFVHLSSLLVWESRPWRGWWPFQFLPAKVKSLWSWLSTADHCIEHSSEVHSEPAFVWLELPTNHLVLKSQGKVCRLEGWKKKISLLFYIIFFLTRLRSCPSFFQPGKSKKRRRIQDLLSPRWFQCTKSHHSFNLIKAFLFLK